MCVCASVCVYWIWDTAGQGLWAVRPHGVWSTHMRHTQIVDKFIENDCISNWQWVCVHIFITHGSSISSSLCSRAPLCNMHEVLQKYWWFGKCVLKRWNLFNCSSQAARQPDSQAALLLPFRKASNSRNMLAPAPASPAVARRHNKHSTLHVSPCIWADAKTCCQPTMEHEKRISNPRWQSKERV